MHLNNLKRVNGAHPARCNRCSDDFEHEPVRGAYGFYCSEECKDHVEERTPEQRMRKMQ